jgi:hypothetical protein
MGEDTLRTVRGARPGDRDTPIRCMMRCATRRAARRGRTVRTHRVSILVLPRRQDKRRLARHARVPGEELQSPVAAIRGEGLRAIVDPRTSLGLVLPASELLTAEV